MANPVKEKIIEAAEISFAYHSRLHDVLSGFSAVFGPAKLNVVIGPNGSGKSTLARIIIGYLKGYRGSIKIDGEDIRELSVLETARRVAFVAQENPISAPLTVRDTVELGRFCRMAGGVYRREEDDKVIEESIDLTGVTPLRDKRVDSISGGEKQRVMIARALAQGAGNLVLDEPTANLDLKYQPIIFGLLRHLVDTRGYNVVAITHDVNLAARYADIVCLIKDGRLFARGLPADVVTKPILEEAYETKLRVVGDEFFIPLDGALGGTAS